MIYFEEQSFALDKNERQTALITWHFINVPCALKEVTYVILNFFIDLWPAKINISAIKVILIEGPLKTMVEVVNPKSYFSIT